MASAIKTLAFYNYATRRLTTPRNDIRIIIDNISVGSVKHSTIYEYFTDKGELCHSAIAIATAIIGRWWFS